MAKTGRLLKKIDKEKFCSCVNLFCKRAITIQETAKVIGVDHGTARTRLLKALEIMSEKGGSVTPDDFPKEWFF